MSLLPRDHTEDPLPFDIEPKKSAEGLAGERHVMRVNDGWLVGFDAGEFGGALWWFSDDGSRRRKLAEDNVAGFANSSLGPLALVGLAHMGMDYGKVLIVREGSEGERRVDTLVDLGSAPTAVAEESADSVLVATYDKLLRVRTSGEVQELFAPKLGFIYPNSMTLSRDGVIHVGMRHFILRLSPSVEGHRAEWFVPADCEKFELRDYDCVCLNQREG